jgi:hypothetical protein
MGLSASDIPLVAKQKPLTVTGEQLATAHDLIKVEARCRATIYNGAHELLAVRVQRFDPYEATVSLVRRDGLIVHETDE